MTSLTNLPDFLAYFVSSIVLLGLFLILYTRLLPMREWELIRQGNRAAALSLSGAMLGFSLPLATAIAHSDGLADMAVWAAVSLVLQLACFGVMHFVRRDVGAAIAGGDMAEAILMAAGSVTLGVLNAACLT